MNIISLDISNVKRFDRLNLDFRDHSGNARPWTVLTGPSGCGKTTILQAIALTAMGQSQVNHSSHTQMQAPLLRNRGLSKNVTAEMSATFKTKKPGQSGKSSTVQHLTSRVRLEPNEFLLRAESWWGAQPNSKQDPLEEARAEAARGWFVAAYGGQRRIPAPLQEPLLFNQSFQRTKSLLVGDGSMASVSFVNHFRQQFSKAKAQAYVQTVHDALVGTGLLPPDIVGLELGKTVSTPRDLFDTDVFHQRVGDAVIRVPSVAMSHGHQSTISWVADLVGHIMLEARGDNVLNDFKGLVLVDDIDLHLDPASQASIVPALRRTFPNAQFIATATSPALLKTMDASEVVRLRVDPATNQVE